MVEATDSDGIMAEEKTNPEVTKATVDPSKIDIQKLQYATIIDIAKASYDSFFKLATMSFTLNGLLIGGLSYFLTQATSSSDHVPTMVVAGIAIIGLVYNLGAGCAFISLSDLTSSIWYRLLELDDQLGLEVAKRKSSKSNRWGTYTIQLTKVFFGMWILFWLGMAGWAVLLATAVKPLQLAT